MTNEEAISYLESITKYIDYNNEAYYAVSWEILEAIELAIEALKAQHWIPCSEQLPKENGQYLITVKYVHVDGYDDIYAEHGEWADGKWDMFMFGHCGKVENIIAWMPLPEAYKGDET